MRLECFHVKSIEDAEVNPRPDDRKNNKASLVALTVLRAEPGKFSGGLAGSQVKNYSPGCMEQAPSRGHEGQSAEQAGCGLGAVLQQQKSCVGSVYVRKRGKCNTGPW